MPKQPDIELRKLNELRRIADALEILVERSGPVKVIVRDADEVDPEPDYEWSRSTQPNVAPDDRPGWEITGTKDLLGYVWRRPIVKPMGADG